MCVFRCSHAGNHRETHHNPRRRPLRLGEPRAPRRREARAPPVTARAFSSRSRIDSSARKRRNAGRSCPQRATTAWRWSFCRAMSTGWWTHAASSKRNAPLAVSPCSFGAPSPSTRTTLARPHRLACPPSCRRSWDAPTRSRPATRAVLAGDPENSALSARGLDVVVIGGGDTGNDCVGTPRRIEGSEHEIPAQLVLIACGDARIGSSLVASAIADALACAREVAEVLQF